MSFLWSLSALATSVQTQGFPIVIWVLFFLAFCNQIIISGYRIHFDSKFSTFALFLTLGIASNSFFSLNPMYDLSQSLQYTCLALLGVTLFSSSYVQRYAFMLAIAVLVTTNALLLLLGWYVSPMFAHLATSDGRFETLLNQPGTLGVLAIPVLIYGAYRLSKSPQLWLLWLLSGCALLLVVAENSRTITIQVVLSLLLVLWERLLEVRSRITRFLLTIGTGIVLVTAIALTLPKFFETRAGYFVETLLNDGFKSGLETADPTRVVMWQHLFEVLPQKIFWGDGLGSTVIPISADGVDTMEVHAGALQLWADAGLLAFLGYIGLIIASLWFGAKALQRKNLSDHQRGVLLAAVGISWTFALGNFLHTYSTEWSQWIYLAFAWGTIIHYNRNQFFVNSIAKIIAIQKERIEIEK